MHNIDGAICGSSGWATFTSGKNNQNFSTFLKNLPNILNKSRSVCAVAMIWQKGTKI